VRENSKKSPRWSKEAVMSDTPKILVIEGDEILSQALSAQLELEGFRPQLARNRAQASALLRCLHFDAILSEVCLPDGDGEQIYREAQPFVGSTPIIFTTAFGDVDQAVRLVKAGAADYVQKPYNVVELVQRLRVAAAGRSSPAARPPSWPELTVVSPVMLDLQLRLERMATTNISVVVTGESGSGKEIVVRHLHSISSRADEPFVSVSCANLRCDDGERLLFGELIRGSDELTTQVRPGALEEAGRGTLFLDEIDEMPTALQNRLVQVIDAARYRRVGDVSSLPFEARIFAASDFSGAALRDRLRPDLFHRLAVVEIGVPPLRERSSDIEPLVEAILRDVGGELSVSIRVDADAIAALRAHDWPGNVRELRNRLTRALSFVRGDKIGVADLFPDARLLERIESPKATLEDVRANAERQRIAEVLAAHKGRIGDSARGLGISRVTLWAKMKRLGLTNCA
jgi:DNA-binding NtrC family response regulator